VEKKGMSIPTATVLLLVTFFTVPMVLSIFGLLAVPTSMRHPGTRAFVSVGLLVAGYSYYCLCEKLPKLFLGISTLVVSVGLTWYQIGKFANPGVGDVGDRWIFLGAGVALMAHSMKQIKNAVSGKDVEVI